MTDIKKFKNTKYCMRVLKKNKIFKKWDQFWVFFTEQ